MIFTTLRSGSQKFIPPGDATSSGQGSSFGNPDAPPAMWPMLVWSLLQVKDLQEKHDEGTAMDIGANVWLSQGWNDGNLRVPSLISHLDVYARNLAGKACSRSTATPRGNQKKKASRAKRTPRAKRAQK